MDLLGVLLLRFISQCLILFPYLIDIHSMSLGGLSTTLLQYFEIGPPHLFRRLV